MLFFLRLVPHLAHGRHYPLRSKLQFVTWRQHCARYLCPTRNPPEKTHEFCTLNFVACASLLMPRYHGRTGGAVCHAWRCDTCDANGQVPFHAVELGNFSHVLMVLAPIEKPVVFRHTRLVAEQTCKEILRSLEMPPRVLSARPTHYSS